LGGSKVTERTTIPLAVSLREITRDNLDTILGLTVSEVQSEYIATNAKSLAQAFFYQDVAWFRAIYWGDTAAGFVMLEQEPGKPPYLWRLMIDAGFQGNGVGQRALDLIVEKLSQEGATLLRTSYYPGPDSPQGFYGKLGFVPTGEIDDDEVVLELSLSA
jgi:diamine N-acetyltransferase